MRHPVETPVLAAMIAMVCGLATAQPAGPVGSTSHAPGGLGPGLMGHGPDGGRGFADPDGYLASMKARLSITAAQETAWSAYAEVVKSVSARMEGVHKTIWDAMGTANWEERRNMMNQMFEAHEDAFQTVRAAADKLDPALTVEQRTRATGLLPGLRGTGPWGPHWR